MEAETNHYEQQREDRIKRNKEVLIQTGILTAVSVLDQTLLLNRRQGVASKTKNRVRQIPKDEALSIEPSRRSSRLRGEAPALVQCNESEIIYRYTSWTMPTL